MRARLAAALLGLLGAAAGCGGEEDGCGDGGCAATKVRVDPGAERGTLPAEVLVTATRDRWRVRLTGPGGPSCRPRTVERRTGSVVGSNSGVPVRPRAFGRRTWCPGRFVGAAEHDVRELRVAFRAAPPPRSSVVDRAARDFAALRTAPVRSFGPATRDALRSAGALSPDADLIGRFATLEVALAPVDEELCLFAVDADVRSDVPVCRTPEQAAGRETLSGRVGRVAFALLPDAADDVRAGGRPVPVRDGFFAVSADAGRLTYRRGGLRLPVRVRPTDAVRR